MLDPLSDEQIECLNAWPEGTVGHAVSQKASQIQNRTAQELMNEGKSRIGGLIGAGVCLILAWLFGIVLILSIILNVIDYIKAPVA